MTEDQQEQEQEQEALGWRSSVGYVLLLMLVFKPA